MSSNKSERDLKSISEYTKGDFVAVGITVLVVAAVVAFLVLALVGVIPGATATGDSEPAPTVTASPTPVPPPEPLLLGGENRRACGLYWESYEWVVVDRRGTPAYAWLGVGDDIVYYFTDNLAGDEEFVTLKDGCVLYESSSFLRRDAHKDFDVEQFRVGEHDLFHWGVMVEKEPR
ncbi:hypothetical protein LCGC14_1011070 [marine sediment metagenome]|uniref:Uncharacterized protein n=1 Tax=marine sediment metagenome TaxID=412755 RepID=A0A0F9N0D6_9ZZZZ